jgi:hypothetical protein
MVSKGETISAVAAVSIKLLVPITVGEVAVSGLIFTLSPIVNCV